MQWSIGLRRPKAFRRNCETGKHSRGAPFPNTISLMCGRYPNLIAPIQKHLKLNNRKLSRGGIPDADYHRREYISLSNWITEMHTVFPEDSISIGSDHVDVSLTQCVVNDSADCWDHIQ